MAHEVVSIGADGQVQSEMHGFQGKACLKAAAEIAQDLERLGVITEVSGISMKDTTEIVPATQKAMLKVEEGG
ncbi:MAG: DUF2997 domain-containing protein [Patescibacteria group bacterium]|nr:DUF2997 domain-containing protein [Patescibacteria group bacterium]